MRPAASPFTRYTFVVLFLALFELVLQGCNSDEAETPTGPGPVTRTWRQISGPITTERINDIWGTSSTNVYSVGRGGTVFHYDGQLWDSVASTGGAALNAIWGSSRENVYAVGDSGTVLRFDGAGWYDQHLPAETYLWDISGSSPNRIVAVGRNGTIAEYDGAEWTVVTVGPSPLGVNLFGVYVAPNGRVFVCGGGGGLSGVYEYSNKTVYPVYESSYSMTGIRGTTDRDMFFYNIDGYIWHYDGDSVVPEEVPRHSDINDMYVLADGAAFAVMIGQGVLERQDGQWSMLAGQGRADRTVWSSDGIEVFAGGDVGAIDYYDGSNWSAMINDAITHLDLYDAWCDSDGEVFVVGDSGRVFYLNGGQWQETNTGLDYPLRAVWGRNETDVWAAGSLGDAFDQRAAILHYDGNSWSVSTEPDARDLLSITGNEQGEVYVAGRNSGSFATVFKYDGSSWTTVFEDTETWSPLGLWSADSALAHLVGGPHAWKYDGQSWFPNTDSGFASIDHHWFGIWGRSRDFVLACGNSGLVGIYDGDRWVCSFEPLGIQFHDIWGLSSNYLVAVGTSIRVLKDGVWGFPAIDNYENYLWGNPQFPPAFYMRGVDGTSEGEVIAVGDYGTVLTYSRQQ